MENLLQQNTILMVLAAFAFFATIITLMRWKATLESRNRELMRELERREDERDRLLKKLEFERARFFTIVNQMPAAIAVVEAETQKLLVANPQLARLWAMQKPVECYAIDDFKVFDRTGKSISFREWNIWTALKTGEGFNREIEIQRFDGSSAVVQSTVAPIRDSSGKVVAAAAIMVDITAQTQAREALEKAIAYRDDFLSMASHELKTPLTSLKLQLQVTRRSMRPELETGRSTVPTLNRIHRSVDLCLTQSKRLESLVDDLLDVSRIRAGRLNYHFVRTELVSLVRSLVERMSVQASASGCQIRLQGPPAIWLVCDRLRLEQVLTNLVSNSIKYGSGQPIEVSLHAESDQVEITVKDYGKGIQPEKVDQIFEPFERVSDSSSISGLGLGLFISRQIVSAHQGEISVESEPGLYSMFTVHIPQSLRPEDASVLIS